MDSRGRPNPTDQYGVQETFKGFRQALAVLSIPQLMDQLTRINAAMEADAQLKLRNAISTTSWGSSSLDDPVVRSTRTATRGAPAAPTDRGAGPSLLSPPPGPLDLLARSGRLGPRLAAKLVAADIKRTR